MASQKNDPKDLSKTASEELVAEADGATESEYLHLLKDPTRVKNADRLRFMARLSTLEPLLKEISEDEKGLAGADAKTIDALADFTEYMAETFAKTHEDAETVEFLPFDDYLTLVFAYLDKLGELLGSSN